MLDTSHCSFLTVYHYSLWNEAPVAQDNELHLQAFAECFASAVFSDNVHYLAI